MSKKDRRRWIWADYLLIVLSVALPGDWSRCREQWRELLECDRMQILKHLDESGRGATPSPVRRAIELASEGLADQWARFILLKVVSPGLIAVARWLMSAPEVVSAARQSKNAYLEPRAVVLIDVETVLDLLSSRLAFSRASRKRAWIGVLLFPAAIALDQAWRLPDGAPFVGFGTAFERTVAANVWHAMQLLITLGGHRVYFLHVETALSLAWFVLAVLTLGYLRGPGWSHVASFALAVSGVVACVAPLTFALLAAISVAAWLICVIAIVVATATVLTTLLVVLAKAAATDRAQVGRAKQRSRQAAH